MSLETIWYETLKNAISFFKFNLSFGHFVLNSMSGNMDIMYKKKSLLKNLILQYRYFCDQHSTRGWELFSYSIYFLLSLRKLFSIQAKSG